MRVTVRSLAVAAPAAMALLLAGCTTGADDSDATPDAQSSSAPTSDAPSSSAPTTSESVQIDTETLHELFTSSGFDPEAFDTPEEMVDSIYPGVSAAPDCLAVFGIGAEDPEANIAFGPSIDRTLTAQVSSFAAPADAHYETMSDHADACVGDPQLRFDGTSVDATVERQDIDDTSFELTVTATIQGSEVSVIANVEQVEQNVVSVVGWDPQTNEENVPAATSMLVEGVSAARTEG